MKISSEGVNIDIVPVVSCRCGEVIFPSRVKVEKISENKEIWGMLIEIDGHDCFYLEDGDRRWQ